MIYNVTQELVKKGHQVYLVGAGNAQVDAEIIPVVPMSLRESYPNGEFGKWRDFLRIYHAAKILKIIKDLHPDVVYNHYEWPLVQFEDFIECPMFNTIHGPLSSHIEKYSYADHPTANYVSISNNQRKAMPDLNWVKTVYNGIDVHKYEVGNKSDRDYFVFLGRTSPEKGLRELCLLIKETPYQLKIAAKVDPVDQEYFEQQIKPLIDQQQIQFVGEVNFPEKVELLKHARALLLWLNWEEPFGLVVTEAMACGTPVIVNKRGAMPELVVNGQTGFLVDSLEEMKEKLTQLDQIDPTECRQHVDEHFSASIMAEEYLKLA